MPTMRDVPQERRRRPPATACCTQAPPNTGAGWYTLATGAWPGVHGSTNNTFHINGQPFAQPHRRLRPGVLQAESIAQSAERGGLKVAQVEWAGGRNATIQGPTIDFQTFFSGRGVATNFIGRPASRCSTTRRSSRRSGCSSTTRRASPARRRSRRPRRRRRPAGPTCPTSYSPAKEMRLRVLDFGVDKYGLNAYIYDSTNDGTHELRPGAVLAAPRTAPTPSATSRKGEWADVKVTIVGGALDGKTAGHAGQGRGADRRPVAGAAVPHLGQPRHRHLADLAGRARLHRRLRRVPRPEVPDLDGRRLRRSSRPASSARRPTSSRACTGRPATGRCSSTSPRPTSPTCCWPACRRPTSSSTSSSAWSPRRCPNGAAQPGLRRRRPRRRAATAGSRQREALHPRGVRRRPTRR